VEVFGLNNIGEAEFLNRELVLKKCHGKKEAKQILDVLMLCYLVSHNAWES
jgi:hypothetical protein